MKKAMKELINTIQFVSANELNRANEIWPQFHSKHEAVGVLDEEIWEMEKEHEQFNKWSKELHLAVYQDFDLEKPLTQMEYELSAALAEGIQCLAMLKKFRCLLEREVKKNG